MWRERLKLTCGQCVQPYVLVPYVLEAYVVVAYVLVAYVILIGFHRVSYRRTILFIALVPHIFRIPLDTGIIKAVRRRFRPS